MLAESRHAHPALTNPLFLNTVLLGGTTSTKLAAASAAGFDGIELWRQDVEAVADGPGAVRRLLAAERVSLTDYQVLIDFDGAPGTRRQEKRAEATQILDEARQVGASTVLAPASTDPNCDPDRVEEDMRWLAKHAAERGLRVAYEGMAWSTINPTLAAAWELVERLDEPNLGLVVDAFHLFVRDGTAAELGPLEAERIYLVQLSDLDQAADLANIADTARHRRLLPGEGRFPLESMIERLRTMGYEGPVGIEVFNDALKAADPFSVARRAIDSLRRCLQT